MRITISGLMALCLAAAACSYQFGIEASFRGSNLVFTAENDGWFATDPCVRSLEIITRDERAFRPVWRVEQKGRGAIVCAPFPIVYGHVPAGLRQSVAAEVLKPGADYEIVASSGNSDGYGSFRISAYSPRTIERPD
jgi:hypothetical protein